MPWIPETSLSLLALLLVWTLICRVWPSCRASDSDDDDDKLIIEGSILAVVKEPCRKKILPIQFDIFVMPRGTRVKAGELAGRLAALDIDEGVRIERASGGIKMFINRSPSGVFIVQFDDSKDFQYLASAKQVAALVRAKFGSRFVAWIY
jgi:hypothetical protein